MDENSEYIGSIRSRDGSNSGTYSSKITHENSTDPESIISYNNLTTGDICADSHDEWFIHELHELKLPAMSKEWECHLFGGDGMKYIPRDGQIPNAFVRLMMNVLLGCKWVKLDK